MVAVIFYLILAASILGAGFGVWIGRPTLSNPGWTWPIIIPTSFPALVVTAMYGFVFAETALLFILPVSFVAAILGVMLVLGRDRRGWWLMFPLAVVSAGMAALLLLFYIAISTSDSWGA